MDYVEPHLSASHHWNNRCDKITFNEKNIELDICNSDIHKNCQEQIADNRQQVFK